MKNILTQFLALLFLFFTTKAYSNTINEINFIGLNNSSENTLLNQLPLQIGDEYTDSSSNIIIQSLYKTGLFSDISVINYENSLKITLIENPTIKFFDINIYFFSFFRKPSINGSWFFINTNLCIINKRWSSWINWVYKKIFIIFLRS